jgi:hypothetical protein
MAAAGFDAEAPVATSTELRDEQARENAAHADDVAHLDHAGVDHAEPALDEQAHDGPAAAPHGEDYPAEAETAHAEAHEPADGEDDEDGEEAEEDIVESVGGDDVLEEVPERAFRPRRQYKIQEVIKRRQVCWCRWSRKNAATRAPR